MAATRSLTGTISALVNFSYINTLDANSSGAPAYTVGNTISTTFTSGTGASAANRALMSLARSLTSGNSETIDLYDLASLDIGGGAGKDGLGQSWALDGVKGFMIRNISTSVGSLVVGNDGTTACWNSFLSASDTASFTLVPGAYMLICDPSAAGLDVTDTSNHLLKIAASGGDLTYDIYIIGRT